MIAMMIPPPSPIRTLMFLRGGWRNDANDGGSRSDWNRFLYFVILWK